MTDANSNPERRSDECSCCSDAAADAATGEPVGVEPDERFLDDGDVLDDPLPADVGSLLGRLLGGDPPETLGDWTREVRRQTDGDPIAVADLCHADEETAHWGEVDGERYHFRCFYDIVALAALVGRPADVRTETPGGAVLAFRATADGDLTDVPVGTTVSFGVARDVDPPADGDPVPAAVYEGVCPYVRAFTDRAAYRRWARDVPAVTVAMPLANATAIAGALVD